MHARTHTHTINVMYTKHWLIYTHHASEIFTLTHFLLFSLLLSSLSLFSWAAVLYSKDRAQCTASNFMLSYHTHWEAGFHTRRLLEVLCSASGSFARTQTSSWYIKWTLTSPAARIKFTREWEQTVWACAESMRRPRHRGARASPFRAKIVNMRICMIDRSWTTCDMHDDFLNQQCRSVSSVQF